MSHTGSVSVFGAEPNPLAPILEDGGGGGSGTDGTFWLEEGGSGGGRLDCKNGEEETTGIEARGGLGGRAGSTVAGADWTLTWMRFSISSMSDWEEG